MSFTKTARSTKFKLIFIDEWNITILQYKFECLFIWMPNLRCQVLRETCEVVFTTGKLHEELSIEERQLGALGFLRRCRLLNL